MADDKAQASTEDTTTNGQDTIKPKRGRKRKTEMDNSVDVVTNADTTAEMNDVETSVLIETIAAEPAQTTDFNHTSTLENIIEANALTPEISEETPTVESHNYASGCGDVLKSAREAQGLSIQEVCKQLRLSAKQIQAIEQDDFAQLPQKSIVRGFIRNYARLLKIDAAPILLAYQQLVPEGTPLALSVKSNASESVIQSHSEHIRPGRILNLLLFFLAVSIMGYFYTYHIKPDALKKPTQALDAGDIESAPMESSAMSIPNADETATTSSVAVDPSNQQTTSPEPTTSISPLTESTPSTPMPSTTNSASNTGANAPTTNTMSVSALATAAEASNNASPSTDIGKTQLNFKVSGESWVRVEDSKGNKIFSQVMTAGSEQTLSVDKPLNIIVGNASVTKLTIDTQPYDLTQTARGHVARIQLK